MHYFCRSVLLLYNVRLTKKVKDDSRGNSYITRQK